MVRTWNAETKLTATDRRACRTRHLTPASPVRGRLGVPRLATDHDGSTSVPMVDWWGREDCAKGATNTGYRPARLTPNKTERQKSDDYTLVITFLSLFRQVA